MAIYISLENIRKVFAQAIENTKLAKKAYTQMGMDRNVQTFCTKVGAHARMLKKKHR